MTRNSASESPKATRFLGAGVMGVVYEAWDVTLARRVALKVMHPHLTLEQKSKGASVSRDTVCGSEPLDRVLNVQGVAALVYNTPECDATLRLDFAVKSTGDMGRSPVTDLTAKR